MLAMVCTGVSKPRVRFANPKFEFGSVPAIAGPDSVRFRRRGGRIRFGSGIHEPDSVRFWRSGTGFGSVSAPRNQIRFGLAGSHLGEAPWVRLPLGSGWFIGLLVVALASRGHTPDLQRGVAA